MPLPPELIELISRYLHYSDLLCLRDAGVLCIRARPWRPYSLLKDAVDVSYRDRYLSQLLPSDALSLEVVNGNQLAVIQHFAARATPHHCYTLAMLAVVRARCEIFTIAVARLTYEDICMAKSKLFRYACAYGCSCIVRELLHRFPMTLEDVRAENNEALLFASRHPAKFKLLLDSFNYTHRDLALRNYRLLRSVCGRGSCAALLLITWKFSPLPDDFRRVNGFVLACTRNHVDFVGTLLHLRIPTKIEVEDGFELAAARGHIGVVKNIISLRKIPTGVIRRACTCAWRGRHTDIVEYLNKSLLV